MGTPCSKPKITKTLEYRRDSCLNIPAITQVTPIEQEPAAPNKSKKLPRTKRRNDLRMTASDIPGVVQTSDRSPRRSTKGVGTGLPASFTFEVNDTTGAAGEIAASAPPITPNNDEYLHAAFGTHPASAMARASIPSNTPQAMLEAFSITPPADAKPAEEAHNRSRSNSILRATGLEDAAVIDDETCYMKYILSQREENMKKQRTVNGVSRPASRSL